MTVSDAKDLATIVGVIIALATLVKGVIEYTHQGAQRRAEKYFDLENAFFSNDEFKEICDLLESDDPRLAQIPYKAKLHFLGFHEQVALMLNSKLIRPAVAHYMFGYFAIRCWESDHFWAGVERDSIYWSLFTAFAKQMKESEGKFHLDAKALRF